MGRPEARAVPDERTVTENWRGQGGHDTPDDWRGIVPHPPQNLNTRLSFKLESFTFFFNHFYRILNALVSLLKSSKINKGHSCEEQKE